MSETKEAQKIDLTELERCQLTVGKLRAEKAALLVQDSARVIQGLQGQAEHLKVLYERNQEAQQREYGVQQQRGVAAQESEAARGVAAQQVAAAHGLPDGSSVSEDGTVTPPAQAN